LDTLLVKVFENEHKYISKVFRILSEFFFIVQFNISNKKLILVYVDTLVHRLIYRIFFCFVPGFQTIENIIEEQTL